MAYVWSPSALKLGMACILALYYEKKMGIKPTHTLGRLAAGSFLHKRNENFDKERREYRSLEAYANAMMGRWYHVVSTGKFRNVPILWKNENEQHILANQIKIGARHIYERYNKMPAPIEIEYGLTFTYNGISYKGIIDEINRKHLLIDLKNSNLDENLPWNQVRFIADIQPTHYLLGYSVEAHNKRSFRETVGLNEEEKKMIENDPLYLMDKAVFGFHDLKNGSFKYLRRTREDIKTLESIAREHERKLDQHDISPNTDYCRDCKFNDQCPSLIGKVLGGKKTISRQLKLFQPEARIGIINTTVLSEPIKRKKPIQRHIKFDRQ